VTRIAVVQPALALGDVARNLERIEDLIRDAHREYSPAVILVPEACTTPNVFAKVLRETPRQVDGQPFQLLTRLARELGCAIGGGFVAVRGRHAYGTFVLAEPDGAVHLHDKDIPTAWEQHFYVGGDDRGVTQSETLGCTVGLMSGWEWARFRTSARVRAGGARVVLGGMCWPSMPLNWPGPLHVWAEREHGIWREQARALPGQVARLTGAPVAHASHVGAIEGETPLGPIEQRYWIPRFTLTTHVAWHAMNAHGALAYRLRHARGGFPWQAWPSGDLPDEIPPSSPADAPAATTGA